MLLYLGDDRAADNSPISDLPDRTHMLGLRDAETYSNRQITLRPHSRYRRQDVIR